MDGSLFAGLMFFGAGLAFICATERHAAAARRRTAEATGEVVDAWMEHGEESERHTSIHFTTENDKSVYFSAPSVAGIGDLVAVAYNPANLEDAQIGTYRGRNRLGLLVGSLLTVVGALILILGD